MNCSIAVTGNIDTLSKNASMNVNRNSITVWWGSANPKIGKLQKNEVVHYLMGYCMFYVHVGQLDSLINISSLGE